MKLNERNLNQLIESIEAVVCGNNQKVLDFKNGCLNLCGSFKDLLHIDFSSRTEVQQELSQSFQWAYHEIKFVIHGIYLENIENQNQYQGVENEIK